MSKLIIPEPEEILNNLMVIQSEKKKLLVAMQVFLVKTARDKPVTTYKTYCSKMKVYQSFIEGFDLSGNTREDLKAFKSHLRDKYSSANTINLTLSVVRQLYRNLYEVGALPTDFSYAIKNVTADDEVLKSSISREQFYKILEVLRYGYRLNKERDIALFILLTMNGLRVSEASNACIEDIGMNAGKRVLYLKRKGHIGKNKFVVLQEKTFELLEHLAGGRKSGAIFRSSRTWDAMTGGDLSRVIKTIFRRAGIDDPKVTAHSLRHSYAIFALEGGADLLSVSLSMNHKNLSTTQRYLKSFNRLRNSAEDAVNLDF